MGILDAILTQMGTSINAQLNLNVARHDYVCFFDKLKKKSSRMQNCIDDILDRC